jgi:phosphoribosylformylglycinamidine cyclo-ligase
MGIGMIVIISGDNFKKAQAIAERAGEKVYTIGRVIKGDRKVQYS